MRLRRLLWPFSLLYEMAARGRVWAYRRGILSQQRLNKPVISVGNLTVGGTGKTPMALWIAQRLIQEGKRVAILTRGYKGETAHSSGAGEGRQRHVRSDEASLLLARLGQNARLGIGADRFAAGLEQEGWADCFLLDDGFQHLRLLRDVNILLIDFTDPFGGGQLLPAGNLREPKSAMERADVVVVTRTSHAPALESVIRRYTHAPVFYATTKLQNGLLEYPGDCSAKEGFRPEGANLFAFCGIGNPRAFFADARLWGLKIVGEAAFRDHHRYSQEDADDLERKAKSSGADALLCTEKDTFNLPGVQFREMPVFWCPIELELNDADRFWRLLKSLMSRDTKANAA